MSMWDVFLLYLMIKNVCTSLPREVPFSLILSCPHKTLAPTRADLVGQGLISSGKQVPTLLLTTRQPKFVSNPTSCCLRPFPHSLWDVTWHYLHLTAGFLSSFGLLAWRHSQTTRDLTSPSLPWDIWFHTLATGIVFLFLGRQGQLGMWISSCLGFTLTSGGSGRIWGAWRPLMILLSQRVESVAERTGAVDRISLHGQVGTARKASAGIRTVADF